MYPSATSTVHDYGTDHFETVEYNFSELLGLFQDVRDHLDYYTYQQKQPGLSRIIQGITVNTSVITTDLRRLGS